MTSEPRYYVKVCGICHKSADTKLTKISAYSKKTVYRPLCDDCKREYEVK